MKVLSLAWKYHPSVTSGIGVACEGLNNALSRIVELTVIYPKVSKVQVVEEVLLSSSDLTSDQKQEIENEYYKLMKDGQIELAVKFDPYYVSKPKTGKGQSKAIQKKGEIKGRKPSGEITIRQVSERLLYDDVDVFGESVKDKVFLYNRLVDELADGLDFDIIHAHDWMTFLAAIALKNKFQKPLVLHVHSLEYDRVGHKDVGWVYDIERFAMSKADRVISVSNYTKGIIESNYGLSQNHIRTVYNAITFPEKIEIEARKNHRAFKVLFAGRIDGNKGIEYFISIARLLLKKHQAVEFIVVGRGLGKVNFEEIDGFDELQGKFRYMGFIEREALFKLYSSCDVLCMPSISEPFGLTALEAAYMNLPIVLSKKTGVSEILKRTPSADFWDIKKFADHLHSIIKNPKVRSRIIAKNRRDIKGLSWEKSAMEVQKVYQDLLS